MPNIVIADENNRVIGSKDREALEHGDIYQVSALWIENSNLEALLAQRAFSKRNDPGKWGPAVAGTVEEGEDYALNIVKESEEEIGLRISVQELEIGPFHRITGPKNDYFCQWYVFTTDQKEFTVQQEEVVDARWFKKSELRKLLKTQPEFFIRSTPQWIKYFL